MPPSPDEPNYEPSPAGSASAIRRAESITILVVDDERAIRRVIGAHLARRGFIVLEAGNGEEALAALAVRRFDILLTDLQMPKLDGHALLRRVQDEYPLMRRVVMTGYTTLENALDALKLGAVAFVPKPVDLPALDQALDLAVSEMRLWMSQLAALRRLRPGAG